MFILGVLKLNVFAEERIERSKFPKHHVQKYGVNNLYKFNLDSRTRLVHTLVAEETGIAVVEPRILDHEKYEPRAGQTEIMCLINYDVPGWFEGQKTSGELDEVVDKADAYILGASLYCLGVVGLTMGWRSGKYDIVQGEESDET